jgi:hypothetical protein
VNEAKVYEPLTNGSSYQLPPDERRCTHTYEDGRQCKGWRTKSGEHCTGHAGVAAFTSETGRAAQAASVKARRRRRYARELMQLKPGTLTADDVLRVRAAEDAVELAEHMLAPLADPDLSTRARAEHAAWVADRARPDLRPDLLAAITLERAKAQLAASPDPRAALGEMSDAELQALAAGDVIEGEAIELSDEATGPAN